MVRAWRRGMNTVESREVAKLRAQVEAGGAIGWLKEVEVFS